MMMYGRPNSSKVIAIFADYLGGKGECKEKRRALSAEEDEGYHLSLKEGL
jgi:hypothetical protein